MTVQQEIDAPLVAKPYVVLLGAGATRAALPSGDTRGGASIESANAVWPSTLEIGDTVGRTRSLKLERWSRQCLPCRNRLSDSAIDYPTFR